MVQVDIPVPKREYNEARTTTWAYPVFVDGEARETRRLNTWVRLLALAALQCDGMPQADLPALTDRRLAATS